MKNFFLKSKKCSFQILANGLKLLEKLVWGVVPIFQPATPQNVIETVGAGVNSYITVTTGRGVMVYGSKSAEIPCSYLC